MPSGAALHSGGRVSSGLAESLAVEELWQEDHGRDIGVVRAHASHRERDDRGVVGDRGEVADHAIERSVHLRSGPQLAAAAEGCS